ncbi:dihydroxyacetone kinase subunit L [Bacillus sp. N9]
MGRIRSVIWKCLLKSFNKCKGKESLSIDELGKFLNEASEGIKARGKAQVGDKTMIDVWDYAPGWLLTKKEKINWSEWSLLLRDKMEKTSDLEAKKGRAAYLGSRSIGHVDPGAVSSYLLLKALADVLKV